ncbi:MAG: hypothetical protein DCC67_19445 [Planctomycetota bacterium]|nr:MAG: hypothetical protein DCC67_19445 [Planctomycetota bacterium]
MMLQRRFLLAVAALAVTAAPAWAQIVIGNFEGGTDGWAATSGTGIYPDNSPGYGGFFATNGSYALNLLAPDLASNPPSGTFRWSMQLDNNDIPNLGALFAANPILIADVGFRTDEWADPDANWARWDTASINNNVTGWKQTSDANMDDTSNPGFPGGWDQTNFGATNKRTIRWNFQEVLTPAELAGIAAGTTYFQINLSTNYDANYNTAGGSYWIDNIRLAAVPEPATATLAGLAGLMAIAARRRRG